MDSSLLESMEMQQVAAMASADELGYTARS
jgi:hypothetical protein